MNYEAPRFRELDHTDPVTCFLCGRDADLKKYDELGANGQQALEDEMCGHDYVCDDCVVEARKEYCWSTGKKFDEHND